MPVPTPNASGFIPNESVIDGIGKLMELFGPEARARRKANLEQTQAGTTNLGAQTRHTNVTTDYIPKVSAQEDRRIANEEGKLGESQYQFDLTNPLDERRVAAMERDTSNIGVNRSRQTGVAEGSLQHQITNDAKHLALFGQEQERKNKETDYQIQQGQDQAQRGWEQLRKETQWTDAQIAALNKNSESAAALSLLHTLSTGMPPAAGSDQERTMEGLIDTILSKVDPKAAELRRKARADATATKDAELQRIQSAGKNNMDSPEWVNPYPRSEPYYDERGNVTPANQKHFEAQQEHSYRNNPFSNGYGGMF